MLNKQNNRKLITGAELKAASEKDIEGIKVSAQDFQKRYGHFQIENKQTLKEIGDRSEGRLQAFHQANPSLFRKP